MDYKKLIRDLALFLSITLIVKYSVVILAIVLTMDIAGEKDEELFEYTKNYIFDYFKNKFNLIMILLPYFQFFVLRYQDQYPIVRKPKQPNIVVNVAIQNAYFVAPPQRRPSRPPSPTWQ